MTDWLRLWHDMPTDPKWRVIARKSGKPLPCVLALYTLMLTTASAADDRGSIASLTDEDAAAALDMDEEDVAAIKVAMTGRVIDGDRLTGWERRQPKRERENDDSSQRVKKHREAKASAVTDDVTPRNAMQRQETPREEKSREDKEKKEEEGGFAFCGKVVRLNPRDFDRWSSSFPDIDLRAALQTRDDWLAGQEAAARAKWFNSTSSWLAKRQQELRAASKKEQQCVYPVA